jgi:hypothetical protein
MGFSRGPKIVTDGLVLALDAANPKSYPGSGTTWSDLSGNGNDGSLINGPTFDSGNNGSIVFDGVDDRLSVITFDQNPFLDEFTIEIVSIVDKTNSRLISQNHSTINPNTIYINYPNFENLTFAVVDSNQNRFSTFRGSLIPNEIYHMSMAVDLNQGKLISYLNGRSKEEDISNFSGNLTNERIFIGCSEPGKGALLQGNIFLVRIYSKYMNQSKILHNFNSTKSRYGL